MKQYLLTLPLALLAASAVPAAPPKVVFSKQVLPVLSRECASCHTGSAAPGGFSIESRERLFAGGRHGKAVIAGKSGDSTLVRYLTGEIKPQMPPGKPIALDTIALIRRWIDEGAKVDSMVAPQQQAGIMRGAMPMNSGMKLPSAGTHAPGAGAAPLPGLVTQSAPVTALAYSPDGTLVAAGGYRKVRLLEPVTGAVTQTLDGPSDQVLWVAWSPDGKYLAAAGGVPGSFGEVCVWSAAPATGKWEKPRVLRDHADTIYCLAWRPGTSEFATASQDKTVKVWNLRSGKVTRTLKDHADVVFGVAYSPDGKWLASASGDRSVKLYQVDKPGPPTSLPHGEGVTNVVFSPKGDLLVTAALDKQVRVWPVKAEATQNPLRSHGEGEAVDSLAFSADGSTFAWGAINRRVRIFNGDVSGQRREMGDSSDWVYAVTLSPDGKTVAAGSGDGKVYFWTTADGKLTRAVPLGPAAAVAANAPEVKK